MIRLKLTTFNRAIEAGHVRYSWGRWVLDDAGLERLSLPEHLMDLITARIEGLEDDAREILAAAALFGARFSLGVLRQVAPAARGGLIDDAIQTAVSGQIVESLGGDAYGFMHDRLREALLSHLDGRDRPALHRKIAEALQSLTTDESAESEGDAHIHALAHHYYEGRSPEVSNAGFLALWKAAKAAHRAYAFEQAIASDDCDSFLRAQARFELAKMNTIRTEKARQHLIMAMKELGCGYIHSTPLHLARTLFLWAWRVLRAPRPVLAHETRLREQLRLTAECYIHAGFVEFLALHPLGMIQSTFRAQWYAARLGTSSTLARWYAGTGALLAAVGIKGLSQSLCRRAKEIARALGDPMTQAAVALYTGHALEYAGDPVAASDEYAGLLEAYAKWTGPWDRYSCAGMLVSNLHMRGDARGVERWLPYATRPVSGDEGVSGRHGGRLMACAMATARAMTTRIAQEIPTARAERDALLGDGSEAPDRLFLARLLGYVALQVYVAGGADHQIDELVEVFEAQRAPLKRNHQLHVFTIAEIWIRLRQLEAPSSSPRTVRAAYFAARARLKQGARHPSVRAHLLAAEAGRHLVGRGCASDTPRGSHDRHYRTLRG